MRAGIVHRVVLLPNAEHRDWRRALELDCSPVRQFSQFAYSDQRHIVFPSPLRIAPRASFAATNIRYLIARSFRGVLRLNATDAGEATSRLNLDGGANTTAVMSDLEAFRNET